jgi:hypothetical protein
VAILKEFNGTQPRMGNDFIIMKVLHHHVATLRNALFNMPSHLMIPLEGSIKKRQALIFSDLQYVVALFNTHLIHDMELHDDQHAMAGHMRIFQTLSYIDKDI